MKTVCEGCGQPIKPMRGVPGHWVHASRTTASCDLDADHVPRPAETEAARAPEDQPTRGHDETSG